MPFSGTPVVKQIADNVVRISGVALDGGASGTIGLSNSVNPVDVTLPASFKPGDYSYLKSGLTGTTLIELSDSIQVTYVRNTSASYAVPITIIKSGSHDNFLITVANTSGGFSGILGRAAPFGISGGGAITNIGGTVVTGDLGLFPGAGGPFVGFPPGVVTGTQHIGDAQAFNCFRDASSAYAALSALAPTQDLSGQDLGGLTLGAGIYQFTAGAVQTGVLTLDAGGDSNSTFVIQVGTTLTVNPASTVVLSGAALADNVFWVVGTSGIPFSGAAAIGAGVTFVGSILASFDINVGTLTTVDGRLLITSIFGTVETDDNAITVPTPGASSSSGLLEIYVRFH